MFSDTSTCVAYLSGIIGTTDFLALSSSDQGLYFNTAFEQIMYNPRYSISETDTDTKLMKAQALLANALLSDPQQQKRAELRAAGVTQFTVADFSETYAGESDGLPVQVAGLLKHWRIPGIRVTTLRRC